MPPITIRSEGMTTREVTRMVDGQQVTSVVAAPVMSGSLPPRVVDVAAVQDASKVVSFADAARQTKAFLAAMEVTPIIGAQITQGPKAVVDFEAQIAAIREKATKFSVVDTGHDGSAQLTNSAVVRTRDTQIS